MLHVKEVAARLDVHPSTVYRWIKNGLLQAVRYGRLVTPGATVSGTGGAIRIPETALVDFQSTHPRYRPADEPSPA